MNILALDLAEHTGWAWRRTPIGLPPELESGVVTHSTQDDARRPLCYRQGLRLHRFRAWLRDLPNRGNVDLVAYEAPILFAGRPSGAIAAYQYEGVLLAELARRRVPYRSVATGTLKKHATGNGAAKKPAMIRAARERWGITRELDPRGDEADALCVLAWALAEIGEA